MSRAARSLCLATALAAVAACAPQKPSVAPTADVSAPAAAVPAPPPPPPHDVAREKEILAANPPPTAPTPLVGSVRPGNQRALGSAAVPFAKYLHAMHTRIHAEYADKALGELDALPRNHPLNGRGLRVVVEIAVDGATGSIADLVMLQGSDEPGFDALVLAAVRRASPFAAPPAELHSPDGKVYVHWQLARDELYACMPAYARPFLLRAESASP